MIRLTINTEPDADATKEARKICDFLFERCNGNISEAAVLGYLRRVREDHSKFPWTKSTSSDALVQASEAAGT